MRQDDESGPEPPRTVGSQSWLQVLRARLGLSGPQTLRDVLEEALKTDAHAETAFTAAEREMLLRLLHLCTQFPSVRSSLSGCLRRAPKWRLAPTAVICW